MKRPQSKSLSIGDQGFGIRVDVGIKGDSDCDCCEEDWKGGNAWELHLVWKQAFLLIPTFSKSEYK